MTMYLDPRTGSGDLKSALVAIGVPVDDSAQLDFADACWIGRGAKGAPVQVGVEVKKLSDVLNCIVTKRLSGHQLPGMIRQYDVCGLIVEGIWRANPADGVLEEYRYREWRPITLGGRRFQHSDLEHYLTTLEVKASMEESRMIWTRYTDTRQMTARTLAAFYTWWTHKDWDEHKSHLALSKVAIPGGMLLQKPSLLRRWAAELQGIGYDKSARVEKAFKSAGHMAAAESKDWQRIKGIGKTLATRIVAEINQAELPFRKD